MKTKLTFNRLFVHMSFFFLGIFFSWVAATLHLKEGFMVYVTGILIGLPYGCLFQKLYDAHKQARESQKPPPMPGKKASNGKKKTCRSRAFYRTPVYH